MLDNRDFVPGILSWGEVGVGEEGRGREKVKSENAGKMNDRVADSVVYTLQRVSSNN